MEPAELSIAALAAVPPAELDAALRRADLALAAGRLVNPPRVETVGREGDPDYFRLEMPARLIDDAGHIVIESRKVIEEAGATDTQGHRRLGPRSAVLELHHPATGRRVCLDADALTDYRTGAAAAWAIRYLATPPDTLAIVGTGRVACSLARAADRLLGPRLIRLTSRSEANRDAARAALAGTLRAAVETPGSVDEALAGAEVLAVAVPAAEPVITTARAAGRRVVVAVEGDPRARLVAPELLAHGPVVVDEPGQALRSGSFLAAGAPGWAHVDGRPATVADAAAGRLEALRNGGALVVLTGLAAHDLALGAAVWARAGGPADGMI